VGKLIAGMTVVVLCSFAFVLLHLTLRRPAGASTVRGPAPVLETRDDGSVVALDVQLSVFEQRLMEAEKRSEELGRELQEARKERGDLEQKVESLQSEVRKLRRQAAGPHLPPGAEEQPSEPPPADPGQPQPPGNGP